MYKVLNDKKSHTQVKSNVGNVVVDKEFMEKQIRKHLDNPKLRGMVTTEEMLSFPKVAKNVDAEFNAQQQGYNWSVEANDGAEIVYGERDYGKGHRLLTTHSKTERGERGHSHRQINDPNFHNSVYDNIIPQNKTQGDIMNNPHYEQNKILQGSIDEMLESAYKQLQSAMTRDDAINLVYKFSANAKRLSDEEIKKQINEKSTHEIQEALKEAIGGFREEFKAFQKGYDENIERITETQKSLHFPYYKDNLQSHTKDYLSMANQMLQGICDDPTEIQSKLIYLNNLNGGEATYLHRLNKLDKELNDFKNNKDTLSPQEKQEQAREVERMIFIARDSSIQTPDEIKLEIIALANPTKDIMASSKTDSMKEKVKEALKGIQSKNKPADKDFER